MLDQAESANVYHREFRGVFILPLSPKRLRKRLKHPCATLVMEIPNDCMSFIPAHYWQDGKNNAKCYNQASTNMVILLYRSKYADNLPLFSFKSLQAKLAT
eukprot:2574821-Pyramimonas_sp.AAC.1